VVADTKKILVADSKIVPEVVFEMGWETYAGRYCGLICSTLAAGVGDPPRDGCSVRIIAGSQNIPLTAITTIKTTAKRIF
jgi:hypothetical protein